MPEQRFRKGDRVRFQYGIYIKEGIVTEDIGPIGVKRRRLYHIEFRRGPKSEYISEIELPAADLQLIQDAVAKE